MRNRLGTVALALGALLFSCGLAEAGLRLAGFTAIYDTYSKPSLFWIHDEELGWVHEPGARGSYVGPRPFPVEFETRIEINRLGLRGPEVAPKAPAEYRVLALGDSSTVGFEVPYEEAFTALMEARLARRLDVPVRVINAGVRGYGTDQQLLTYRRLGRELQPDLVLLVFNGNDPNDNVTLHRMRRPFGKAGFALRENGQLVPVGVPVPRYPLCTAWMLDEHYEPHRFDGAGHRFACFLQTRAADRSALFTFTAQAVGRLPGVVTFLRDLAYPSAQQASRPAGGRLVAAGVGDGDPPGLADGAALTSALLSRLAREVERDGASFFVMMRRQSYARLDYRALMAQGVDVREIGAPPGVEPWMLRFRNDPHFNARGHRVVAEGLARVAEAYARLARPELGPGERPDRVPGLLTREIVETVRVEGP